MDTIQLRYLIAIANTGHFTEAAALFGISQPTICRQISSLEEELGVTLINRSTHGLTLTAPGKECIEYARRILDIEDESLLRIGNLESGHRDALKIAVLCTVMPFVEPYLTLFSSSYPNIQIDINVVSAKDITVSSDYDIFFSHDGILNPSEFTGYYYLSRTTLSLVINTKDYDLLNPAFSGHPACGQKAQFGDCSVLNHRPFLFMNRSQNSNYYMRIKKLQDIIGLHPEIVCSYNDFFALLTAINSGIGISIIPDAFVRNMPLINLRAMPLDCAGSVFCPMIAWNQNSQNPVVKSFIGLLEKSYPHYRTIDEINMPQNIR